MDDFRLEQAFDWVTRNLWTWFVTLKYPKEKSPKHRGSVHRALKLRLSAGPRRCLWGTERESSTHTCALSNAATTATRFFMFCFVKVLTTRNSAIGAGAGLRFPVGAHGNARLIARLSACFGTSSSRFAAISNTTLQVSPLCSVPPNINANNGFDDETLKYGSGDSKIPHSWISGNTEDVK